MSRTKRLGDSTPRVIRAERKPGVCATSGTASWKAAVKASSEPGVMANCATSMTMPVSLTRLSGTHAL